MERAVVEEGRVGVLAVLAAALAVIGGQDDQRLLGETELADPVHDPAELLVEERDLGVVAVLELLREALRGLVRPMGVEVVQEEEEGLRRPGDLVEELDAPVGDLVGLAIGLDLRGRQLDLRRRLVGVVRGELLDGLIENDPDVPLLDPPIGVETLREPVLLGEHDRCHLGVGRVARVLEDLRHRDVLLGHDEDGVVARAVHERVGPREHRRVRGQGQGRRRDALREARPLGGEAIDVGRPGRRVPVTAQVVGPGRVDRDEYDVHARVADSGRDLVELGDLGLGRLGDLCYGRARSLAASAHRCTCHRDERRTDMSAV